MAWPDRITDTGEYDGNGLRRLHGRQSDACASSHEDDIDAERREFSRKRGSPLDLPLGISVNDHDVSVLDVTELFKAFQEGVEFFVLSDDEYSEDAKSEIARKVAQVALY